MIDTSKMTPGELLDFAAKRWPKRWGKSRELLRKPRRPSLKQLVGKAERLAERKRGQSV